MRRGKIEATRSEAHETENVGERAKGGQFMEGGTSRGRALAGG